ncbi:MAG: HD domain-containing protein [Pseudomonadales bacterium]
MSEKAEIPVSLLDLSRSTPLIEAWFEIVHLKQLYRKGWLVRGVAAADCETVAEHTFGNALLCLLLLKQHPNLDPLRVLKLALIHDIGEAYVGDITPHDNIEPDEKVRLESEAVTKIFGKLPGGEALIADWHEYEAQETPEARFVKQIDRLELAMQASVYEHQGKVEASEFRASAARHVTSDILKAELAALNRLMTFIRPPEKD